MTVLIDSWAWIEYLQGSKAGARAREFIDGESAAIISPVNIAEVWRWVLLRRTSPEAEATRRLMVRRCAVVDFTQSLGVEAAKLRHTLGLGLGDAIVYATTRAANAKLVTGDPDFETFTDVEFIGEKHERHKS